MNDEKLPDSIHHENYRAEYEVVAASWRMLANLRFLGAAFVVALQSALLTLQSQFIQTISPAQPRLRDLLFLILIPFVGMASMTAIMIIEKRTLDFIAITVKRSTELEFHLALVNGYFSRFKDPEVASPRGWRIILTHTGGIGLFYLAIFTLWVVCMFVALTR